MGRFFPRDVLLAARLLAVVGALVWILIGGQATLALAYVALGFLTGTAAIVWRDDVRRHGVPVPLSETPAIVVVGDRKVVEPKLKELGFSMTILDPDGNLVDN